MMLLKFLFINGREHLVAKNKIQLLNVLNDSRPSLVEI